MTSRTDDARPLAAPTPRAGSSRRRHTIRLGVLAAAVLALAVGGLQPASAKSTPSKVGMVSFVGKGFNRSANTASLTISWPAARHAKKYEIYMSRTYGMGSAKKYSTSRRTLRVSGLLPGRDYFFQVRAVNGSKRGTKSTRVGHTAIRQFQPVGGPTYRIMSYNVCSRVCDEKRQYKYNWTTRQAYVQGRIRSYLPDVVAAQEADNLSVPVGYTQAHYRSGKRLFFRTGRFTMDPGTELPVIEESITNDRCTSTKSWESHGEISLGYHGGGCRYSVWAILNDVRTGDRTLFVDVHTVSGDNSSGARDRRAEIAELVAQVAKLNTANLPVIYAGDFNSHKGRSNDYLRTIFNNAGYYDAYDQAVALRLQHYNSYNGFASTAKDSYKWGDHVDKVWMRPSDGRVLRWNNGALISKGKMVPVIPSDHSPIMADVRLN